MNLKLKKSFKFLTIVSIVATLASCQKEAKNAPKPIDTAAAPTLSGLMTAGVTNPLFISNCGIATLITPVSGGGTVILPVGTLLATSQPPGEAAIPSSRSFGPSNIYKLTLTGNGNLIVQNGTTTIWTSQNSGGAANTNNYAILQGDGNLVIRSRNIVPPGTPVPPTQEEWASHDVLCANQGAPILILQSDGNVVEEYPCAHIGNKTYGFIGNTGTASGHSSNHNGSF